MVILVPKMSPLSRAARFACVAAFLISAFTILAALNGPVVALPMAILPLSVGIGILRRQQWSAYGFVAFLGMQMALGVGILVRSGNAGALGLEMVSALLILVPLAWLFLLAGRSLGSGATRKGTAVAWVAACVAPALPFVFVQAFFVPTGAMEDTILIGDRVLVQRFPKPHLEQGDIIAFKYPVDRRQTFLKRIIGTPGDRIRISNKAVYRNGVLLRERYAVHKTGYVDSFRDNFPSEPNFRIEEAALDMLHNHVANGEVVVPDRCYFVLGDNRDSSLDSRCWGFVPFEDVVGKPVLVYDSVEQSAEELMDRKSGWSRRTRWNRILHRL